MASAANPIESIFAAAVGIPSDADRRAYVDQACAGDPALRGRVDELIDNHLRAGSFLESPAPDLGATTDLPAAERPGTVVGPYKLLEQIGEGGFGTVFLAEQTAPVRRKVALKVIKAGMDTGQVVARFEAERQALAVLDHPNIAKVFDGGQTATGRPYFVMELVRGVPITDYCDHAHLAPRDRLELFLSVCQAVQHAHQKGIIHRDLKPSNVLVAAHDGRPAVKVIDFGIAKATGHQLTDKTLFTGFAQMIGTPLYMSPEQAAQSPDIDTRSDIYSLGVLLYELLTGSTPFTKERFRQAAYDEIRRIIREEEPPKPSTRLSDSQDSLPSISALRHTEPGKLTRLFRGEVDWIVMKALEKDRSRRYETANGFAADIQRYLADEPVLACPPSARYRFGKFARRNKRALATAALLAGVLLAAVIELVVNNRSIDRERARTAAERDKTRTANDQLKDNLRLALEGLDEVSLQLAQDRLGRDPKQQKEDDQLLRKALAFYERFAEQNSDDPQVRLEMSRAYSRAGTIYTGLGQHPQARQAHERAVGLAEQLVADVPAEPDYRRALAAAVNELSGAFDRAHQLGEAEQAARRHLDLTRQLSADFPDVLAYRRSLASAHNQMGWSLWRRQKSGAAVPYFRTAVDLYTRVIADGLDTRSSRYKLAQARTNLGAALAALSDPEQVDHWREAIALYTDLIAKPGPAGDDPRGERVNRSRCRRDLAMAHFLLGRRLKAVADHEAGRYLARGIELQAELAAELPNVVLYRSELAGSQLELGDLLVAEGRPADAEEPFRQALEHLTRLVAADPGDIFYRDRLALAHLYLGHLRTDAGRQADAAGHYRSAFALIEKLAAERPKDANCLRGLAWNLATCPDPEFRDPARAVRVGTGLVEATPSAALNWSILGAAHYRAGDWSAAVAALDRATGLKKEGASGDWLYLALAHGRLGHADEARRDYDRAVRPLPTQAAVRRLRVEAANLLGIDSEPSGPKSPARPGPAPAPKAGPP